MSTVPSPWSGKTAKATPALADEILLIDSEDSNPLTKNKRATFASILASITQKTNNVTGFSLAGGTSSSKTLTVTADSTVDQNLSSASSPVFAGAYLSGELRVRNPSNSAQYFSVTYSNANNLTYFQSAGATDYVFGSSGGGLQSQGGFIGNNTASWIGASFGTNSTSNRVVAGMINGGATLGGHSFNFTTWEDLFLQNGGVKGVGVGLNSLTQSVNATFHSAGSTIIGLPPAARADADLYNSQVAPWYDEPNQQIIYKAKSSTGNVTSLCGTGNLHVVTKTSDYTATITDDIILVDSTAGAVVITVSSLTVNRYQTIKKVAGSNNITIRPAATQTINGSSSDIVIYGAYEGYVMLYSSKDGYSMYIESLDISKASAAEGANWLSQGIKYQWDFSTYGPSIPAGSSITVNLLWPAAFPAAVFQVFPSVIENTAGVPVSVKVRSKSTTGAQIEVTNLSNTTATQTSVPIAALAIGN